MGKQKSARAAARGLFGALAEQQQHNQQQHHGILALVDVGMWSTTSKKARFVVRLTRLLFVVWLLLLSVVVGSSSSSSSSSSAANLIVASSQDHHHHHHHSVASAPTSSSSRTAAVGRDEDHQHRLLAPAPSPAPTPTRGLKATLTFSYTGSVQQWVVPANVATFMVDAYGAAGGNYANNNNGNTYEGGLGGYISVSKIAASSFVGKTLFIYVGAAGAFNAAQGFGGGGGRVSSDTYEYTSGGGATDLRTSLSDLSSRCAYFRECVFSCVLSFISFLHTHHAPLLHDFTHTLTQTNTHTYTQSRED